MLEKPPMLVDVSTVQSRDLCLQKVYLLRLSQTPLRRSGSAAPEGRITRTTGACMALRSLSKSAEEGVTYENIVQSSSIRLLRRRPHLAGV